MTLYLVRHGPTHATAMVGWTDLPADLSDTAALSRLRAALPPVRIVSSDLSRAIATADALATGPRLPHDPDLREIHFGAWEGLTFDAAEARDPGLIRAFWETPGGVTAPSGESWNAMALRVGRALDRLADQDTVIVAHFGPILAAIGWATGAAPYDLLAHRIDNLSLTVVEPGRATLINHRP
jgi:alpha-ribazole phosphatase